MERKILPFYMTYPAAVYPVEKPGMPVEMTESGQEKFTRDMEYFQQMYPMGAKQLQREVVQALSILDYDGSVIYDEYPDQFQLYKMAKDIFSAMRSKVWDGESRNEEEAKQLQKLISQDGVEDYIILVLFQEILKRRHRKGNHSVHFF